MVLRVPLCALVVYIPLLVPYYNNQELGTTKMHQGVQKKES
jgi:hypothetical protein